MRKCVGNLPRVRDIANGSILVTTIFFVILLSQGNILGSGGDSKNNNRGV